MAKYLLWVSDQDKISEFAVKSASTSDIECVSVDNEADCYKFFDEHPNDKIIVALGTGFFCVADHLVRVRAPIAAYSLHSCIEREFHAMDTLLYLAGYRKLAYWGQMINL